MLVIGLMTWRLSAMPSRGHAAEHCSDIITQRRSRTFYKRVSSMSSVLPAPLLVLERVVTLRAGAGAYRCIDAGCWWDGHRDHCS